MNRFQEVLTAKATKNISFRNTIPPYITSFFLLESSRDSPQVEAKVWHIEADDVIGSKREFRKFLKRGSSRLC